MPLRLIESIVPSSALTVFDSVPQDDKVVDRWDEILNDDKSLVRMLVDANDVEGLMDRLIEKLDGVEGFRLLLLPVEATLPRPEESEAKKSNSESEFAEAKSPERVSREEIYNSVSAGAKLTKVFVAQVILATLVAAVGLMRGDTAILIGAMVIAPLLGPNMSLCLATTLGDGKLVWNSLLTNLAGVSITLSSAICIGLFFPVSLAQEAIASRTHVAAGDIILGLASGCAGVLAFTSAAPSALIGVMVAVALLPPFAVFGLLLAAGEYEAAVGALMLVTTNVICINLAGTLTFIAQGLRPQSWWELKRARRATRIAITIWVTLLAILATLIYFEWMY